MKPEREPYIQIIVGILAVAAIPPLGVIFFDGSESLVILERWQSGVGAFLGAFFGLGAILIGALLNADLNRRRDERLRDEEARGLAGALYGELLSTMQGLQYLRTQIATIEQTHEEGAEEAIARLKIVRDTLWFPLFEVYRANLDRVDLLADQDPDLVHDLVSITESIAARGRIITHPDYGDPGNEVSEHLFDVIVEIDTRAQRLATIAGIEHRKVAELPSVWPGYTRTAATEHVQTDNTPPHVPAPA